MRYTLSLLFIFICSVSSLAWNADEINSHSGDRLLDIIRHSSGTMIGVGKKRTVVRSEDGVTWKNINIPNVVSYGTANNISLRSLVEIPATKEIVAVGSINVRQTYDGPQGGSEIVNVSAVYVSNDVGKTWKMLRKFDKTVFYNVNIFNDGRCLFSGYSDSIYEYRNGSVVGIFPIDLSKTVLKPDVQVINGVFSLGDDRGPVVKRFENDLYVVLEKTMVKVSHDFGKTWEPVLDEKENFPAVNSIGFLHDGTLLVSCDNGILLSTQDLGKTWRGKRISTKNINDITIVNDTNWWVVGDNGFMAYTTNAGHSWSQLTLKYDNDICAVKYDGDIWGLTKQNTLICLFNRQNQTVGGYQVKETLLTVPEWAVLNNTNNWELRSKEINAEWYLPLHPSQELDQGVVMYLSPESTTVNVDGHIYANVKSLRTPLPTGMHVIIANKQGHFSKQEEINIEIGEVVHTSMSLRPIKLFISPTMGVSFFNTPSRDYYKKKPDYGITMEAGIITKSNIMAAAEFDICILRQYTDLSIIGGYRFEPIQSLLLTPRAGLGVIWNREDSGVSIIRSKEVVNPLFQLGADVNYRIRESFGLNLRPGIYLSQTLGLVYQIRFGIIFWLL